MERNKVILDAALPNVQKLAFLKLGAADSVICEFGFMGGGAAARGSCYPWLAGLVGADPVVAPPGHRFRLRIELERIDARPAADRHVENARELLRSNLCRLRAAGFWEKEIDDLAAAFDGLIRAHTARSMKIHCDADHTED